MEERATPDARPSVSPFARLAFWCGVAAWVAALAAPILLSLAFLIVYPLAFLAVAIGGFALWQIRQYPGLWRGNGWAIAGIALGGVWLPVLVASLLFGRG